MYFSCRMRIQSLNGLFVSDTRAVKKRWNEIYLVDLEFNYFHRLQMLNRAFVVELDRSIILMTLNCIETAPKRFIYSHKSSNTFNTSVVLIYFWNCNWFLIFQSKRFGVLFCTYGGLFCDGSTIAANRKCISDWTNCFDDWFRLGW